MRLISTRLTVYGCMRAVAVNSATTAVTCAPDLKNHSVYILADLEMLVRVDARKPMFCRDSHLLITDEVYTTSITITPPS